MNTMSNVSRIWLGTSTKNEVIIGDSSLIDHCVIGDVITTQLSYTSLEYLGTSEPYFVIVASHRSSVDDQIKYKAPLISKMIVMCLNSCQLCHVNIYKPNVTSYQFALEVLLA